MSTYTQKLDTVKDLINCGLSTTEIVKKMYQAWNVNESKTIEFIQTVKAGYPEAGRASGPYFACAGKSDSIHYTTSYTINQVNAMIVQGSQPKRNFRAQMTRLAVWPELLNDGTECESSDQTPDSYTHQVFIDYTNENTNRA